MEIQTVIMQYAVNKYVRNVIKMTDFKMIGLHLFGIKIEAQTKSNHAICFK